MHELYDLCKDIYFDTPAFVHEEIKIPKDIGHLVLQLEKIERFNDKTHIDPTLVPDNVMAHTLRLIHRARRIYSSELLERMLWIHDLSEIYVGDTSAVTKEESKELVSATSDKENAVARKILNSNDYTLFLEFEKANASFTSGKLGGALPESILAKLIDNIDGNLVFHYFASLEFSTAKNPRYVSDATLTFTRRKFDIFLQNIIAGEINSNIRDVALKLLRHQAEAVVHLWAKVKHPPEILQNDLLYFKDYLTKNKF